MSFIVNLYDCYGTEIFVYGPMSFSEMLKLLETFKDDFLRGSVSVKIRPFDELSFLSVFAN